MGFSKIVSITLVALVMIIAIWHNFIEQIELPFKTNQNRAHKAEFQEIKHMVKKQLNQIRDMAGTIRAELAELKSLIQSIRPRNSYQGSNEAQKKRTDRLQQNTTKYALLGDIGGTNIRFQIVEFSENQKHPLRIIRQRRMKVKDYQLFEDSIKDVLAQILTKQYPQVAVIAVAGPINQNSVVLSNVPQWGNMIGTQMARKFNISQFRFINDFQAASYGLMIIEDSEFVQLNGHSIDENKIRGVIGPGTGLGHSIILKNQQVQNSISVLPSEAGHGDFPLIDQETIDYFNFLKQHTKSDYFSLQSSFCGPTIPLMYQFYAHTHNLTSSLIQITSQNIIQECIRKNPQPIFQKTLQLFIKIYSSAIANFMIQHMTTGGVYLIGGLTKTILPKIKGTDILKSWKQRHPQMKKLVQSIPLIFCNQVDLGLKGAFVMAKQLSK